MLSRAVLNGLVARRGPEKARRGLKVQRGPNFEYPGPRSAYAYAMHIQFK